MRNLATILPLKSILSGKFQHFNVIDASIEMLKNSWLSKKSLIKMKNFKTRPKQRVTLNKLFSHHQLTASYVSGTDVYLPRYTGKFWHLLSKCFENAVVRHLKMVQSEYDFFLYHESIFLSVWMLSKLSFVKWASYVWANLYCEMLFCASFCWL